MSMRTETTLGLALAAIAAALLSAPAYGDGGPPLSRGALSRGEVKVAPPPPPKAQPAPPTKAAPVVPPPAPPAPPAKVEPLKVEPPKVIPPVTPPTTTAQKVDTVPTAPDGARAGSITLDEGVMLAVPQGWAFWPPSDAQAYLRRTQAQMPSGRILGMIAPAETRPSDPNFWGSVVAFTGIGRVAEERGDRFTASDFLDEARNARPQGAPRLIGFPVAPAFDPGRKALTWGERLESSAPGAAERPIRLEHRLLGRRGVVGLSTPARNEQLTQLTALAPIMNSMLGFSTGNAYRDAAAGDPAPVFDLPGVITNRPKSSITVAAAPGGASMPGAPLSPRASDTPNAVGTVEGASGPAGQGLLGLMDGWFQWIAAGVVLLAALPWLIFRRRDDDVDRNLQPGR